MSSPKVGDRVRVTIPSGSTSLNGMVGTVVRVQAEGAVIGALSNGHVYVKFSSFEHPLLFGPQAVEVLESAADKEPTA